MFTPEHHIHEVGEFVVHSGMTSVFRGYHEMIRDVCYISYVDTPRVTIKVRENTLDN